MRYSLKNPFYKSSLAIAVTGAILSGCGGGSDGGAGSGGGQTPSSVALSGLVTGRVADGYIMGATAFLDIDGDKQLDSWEPSQKTEVLDTTDSTNAASLGKFEVDLATWFDELSADNKALVLGYLQDAGLSTADGTTLTAGDLMSAFSVVVDIPADAVDADKPTETIGSAIKLAAPPKPKVSGSTSSNADTFISPITTVLDQKVTAKKKELKEKEALGLTVTDEEKDVTQLVSAAKKEVKTDLGLDETASDDLLIGDYIGAKDDADSTKSDLAKKLHTVAKVTTTLLAKGVNDTTGGSDNATQLDDATRQAIIDAVTEKVLAQLKTIAAVSQKIVDEGGDEDVAGIDVTTISEKAQQVAEEDTSGDSDAASLTEVGVDQDEIEAAKEATEQAQQDDTTDNTTDTVLTAFLSDAPKQIVRGTTGNTLTYRELGLSEATATWATDSTLPETSAVTTSVLDQDTGEWVEVSVASSISGTTQTLTFTPTAPVAEAPLAESEETQTPAAITADTPLTLTRTLSGTVTDLAGKSIRAQVGVPNWKDKITAGSTFTNGDDQPQRARLVAQSASSVTLKLADTLSYNGLKAQIVDGTVSFTDSANNTVTSFITDTVTASDGVFTVPADIAARFNIPADQRDWVDVGGVLGYQLGKNPVIFDWFNGTAFDQVADEALNTDGLVNSPNLVASLYGDTVTVNAASLLIPEGYSLTDVAAVRPELYGAGEVLAVSDDKQFSLSQSSTARVTLTYTSTTAGAEPITQTGYIHRGKDTAGDLVAGRDYKVRSKIQWNPAANEGAGAYEHALEVLLRESRYADLKAATMSGEAIVGTAEVPEDYQVEGIYRVYGPKTVAAGAAPAFDLDGIVDTAAETITLPAVPVTKPADLSAVTASAIDFDGQQLTFTSLAASGAANATDICFDLSLTSGTDTVEKLECAGKPSTDGSYALDLSQLGLNLRAFDSIAISGLTLKESIEGVEVTQTKAITNASVLEKGSLAQQALSGETLYLTAHNETEDTYTYLTVSYNPDTGSWSIIRVNSTGGDNSESPVTMATISGGTLQFDLDGVTSSLVFNANTAEDLTDVTWTQGESTVYLVKQENEASFIQWKNDHATKVFYTNLFRQTPFSAGQGTTCSGSGYKIESGFDLNGNKILDNEEISLTQEVCNGQISDISVVRLDGSTSQCADVGGTRLDITGQEPILLCNSDGTPRNYPQAKELALGFGTWVNALESHAVKVSDSVETQTAELDALVSNDGIDTSMMGLQFAIYALDAAHRQFVQTASTTAQTYDMATLIPELERPSELVSLAGSVAVGVDVDGQPNTLTLTDFSADIDADLLDETNPVITTTVTMDPMSVPALTAANSFTWSMSNVVATANDGTADIGQVTAPSVAATLTTTNDIALVGQTADPGLSEISLNLGSEAAPVRIETLNSPEAVASERVFTGSLLLNADAQMMGYQPSRKLGADAINLTLNGQLDYDGQSLAVNLGLNAPEIYQMDLSGFDAALSELNTGEVLTDWKSVTAVNGLDESYYNAPSSFPQSLTRYSFTDRSGQSRSYALAVTDTGSYQVWRVQSTDWGQVEYDQYDYQTFSSLADAQKAVLASGLTGYSYYGDSTQTQLWADHRVYAENSDWYSLELGGYYDLSTVNLPGVGAAAVSYDLNVDYVDYYQASSARFDNHSVYTASAGFSLKNLKGFDAAGAPSVLPDVALTVEAARTSYTQGDAKFTLSYEGEELTARYHHWDLFAYGDTDALTYGGIDAFAGSLKDFSFTDNAGGLMVMDPTRVSCDWGDGWNGEYNYQDGEGLACALGASRFRLMVNGVDHGKVWQDQHGQWIAVLGDGDPNIDEKQQDEFVVYTPQ